jgi:lipid-A-disaccharide synthase
VASSADIQATPALCTIGIVAGETSGDLLGSQLISALRRLLPNVHFQGIGGPRMEAAGMDVWFPLEKLAVRGYVEVLRHFTEIVGIRRKLKRRFSSQPPDLFIGIDAPDFNLSLEAHLKRIGVPTVHYVSPAIWMWRRERLPKIKRAVSKMLTLFPFEAGLYEREGIAAAFVGHPLNDLLDAVPRGRAARDQLKLSPDVPIFTLMPGSRRSEIEHMADLFIATARAIAQQLPKAQFLVPLATRESRDMFETALYRNDADGLPLTIMFGHAHEAMAASDVVLVASGTATLEAALLGKPMVIAYRMPPASYWLLKGKGYLPYYGLPNILSEKFVVPEFIQDDATSINLSQAMLNLYRDAGVRQRLEQKFADLGKSLGYGAAEQAAQAVISVMGQKRDLRR